ncbi:MAG: hypothetical protein MK538_16485 [Planctomycetes bacterium]|nr:hypothetical protein [Planctomycetota bacterium]
MRDLQNFGSGPSLAAMILAGIDEAGYGPTLGPLVVSASVFRVNTDKLPDLWKMLGTAVCREPDGRRMPIADSKKLFQQRKSLRNLEEGVLPFVELRNRKLPQGLRALLSCVVASREDDDPASYLEHYPWYRDRDLKLPHDTFSGVIRSRSEKLAQALADTSIEHLGLSAYPIEVTQFNRALSQETNKASVSFGAVGAFIRRLWAQYPNEDVEVVVDRQGGRIRYGALLYEKIRPRSLRIEEQSPERSCYVLRRSAHSAADAKATREFRVRFEKDSESRFLPVALASMLSKYLRELHMHLFNDFWTQHKVDLKPTAGYAVDAKRFLKDISELRAKLKIDDEHLIRRR